MGKKIYIAENPYVMYKIIIKAFLNKTEQRDLIIADNIEALLPLFDTIKKFGLFDQLFFYHYDKNDKYHTMKVERGNNLFSSLWFFLKRYVRATIHQKELAKDEQLNNIDFSAYDEIYCSDFDVSRINGYLAVKKIDYILMEHAKYVFNNENIGLVYNTVTYIASFLERLHIITGIRIATKYCKYVEVHENKDLGRCLGLKQIKIWNVDEAISRLSDEDRNTIYKIYSTAYQLQIDSAKKYNLLLTNPLYKDGFVDSLEAQKAFYHKIYDSYLKDYPLMIKPHPRDDCDYSEVFSEAVIVDNGISSEILNFSSELKLHKALTFYSTSINAFKDKADKTQYLSISDVEARQNEFLLKFNNEWRKVK